MRRALIPISPELIGELCRNGELHVRIESGLPIDAKFVDTDWDPTFKHFLVCFESDQFEEVKEGEQPPQLLPVCCPSHIR